MKNSIWKYTFARIVSIVKKNGLTGIVLNIYAKRQDLLVTDMCLTLNALMQEKGLNVRTMSQNSHFGKESKNYSRDKTMDVVSAINYWYKKYLAEKEKREQLEKQLKEIKL